MYSILIVGNVSEYELKRSHPMWNKRHWNHSPTGALAGQTGVRTRCRSLRHTEWTTSSFWWIPFASSPSAFDGLLELYAVVVGSLCLLPQTGCEVESESVSRPFPLCRTINERVCCRCATAVQHEASRLAFGGTSGRWDFEGQRWLVRATRPRRLAAVSFNGRRGAAAASIWLHELRSQWEACCTRVKSLRFARGDTAELQRKLQRQTQKYALDSDRVADEKRSRRAIRSGQRWQRKSTSKCILRHLIELNFFLQYSLKYFQYFSNISILFVKIFNIL